MQPGKWAVRCELGAGPRLQHSRANVHCRYLGHSAQGSSWQKIKVTVSG